jgi:hypothetical protein
MRAAVEQTWRALDVPARQAGQTLLDGPLSPLRDEIATTQELSEVFRVSRGAPKLGSPGVVAAVSTNPGRVLLDQYAPAPEQFTR